MKAILISKNGDVSIHEGEEDFWEDDDVVYAEIETPQFPGNAIYYDDESMQDPGEVRAVIGGVEVPLPAWVVGVRGEDIIDPTVSVEDIKKSIALPG